VGSVLFNNILPDRTFCISLAFPVMRQGGGREAVLHGLLSWDSVRGKGGFGT